MKIKVSEAVGTALDWLVAKCEGKVSGELPLGTRQDIREGATVAGVRLRLHYSTDWSWGGPIIEYGRIALAHGSLFDSSYAEWHATFAQEGDPYTILGPTMLIAGLRAFVISKLGEEVEVPDALLP